MRWVGWIFLAQDKDKWWALQYMVINLLSLLSFNLEARSSALSFDREMS
jgi:hypothetical protein